MLRLDACLGDGPALAAEPALPADERSAADGKVPALLRSRVMTNNYSAVLEVGRLCAGAKSKGNQAQCLC